MFTKEIFALLIVNASNSRYTPPHNRRIRPPTLCTLWKQTASNTSNIYLATKTPFATPLSKRSCRWTFRCVLFIVNARFTWYTTPQPPHTTTNALHALKTDRKQCFSCNEHPFETPLSKRSCRWTFRCVLFIVNARIARDHHPTTATYDHQRTARFENRPQATLYLQWTPLCNTST